jgi:hypothetical protein
MFKVLTGHRSLEGVAGVWSIEYIGKLEESYSSNFFYKYITA